MVKCFKNKSFSYIISIFKISEEFWNIDVYQYPYTFLISLFHFPPKIPSQLVIFPPIHEPKSISFLQKKNVDLSCPPPDYQTKYNIKSKFILSCYWLVLRLGFLHMTYEGDNDSGGLLICTYISSHQVCLCFFLLIYLFIIVDFDENNLWSLSNGCSNSSGIC